MSSVGVLVELRVKPEAEERFIVASRQLRLQSRNDGEVLRFELVKRPDEPCSFVLYVVFRNEAAAARHAAQPHTRVWVEELPSLTDSVVSRRVSAVAIDPVPPPLPRPLPPMPVPPPRRPALESATHLKSAVPPPSAGRAAPLRLPRLEVVLERMEIATATDGFWRGSPEPCLVVACYQLGRGQVTTLGRAIYRFELAQSAPCALTLMERLLDLPVQFDKFPIELCVLVCALEENGGRDIQSVYRQLGAPEQFLLWRSADAEPEPRNLCDMARSVRSTQAEGVQVLTGGQLLQEPFEDDTWVGAACAVAGFTAVREERLLSFHTASGDGSNDWLSALSLRLGYPS
ncbi:MAG: antibiotic biosynthesis monooxygenase [Polyangiaceae bacterium]